MRGPGGRLSLGADLGSSVLPGRAVVFVGHRVERPLIDPALGQQKSREYPVQLLGVLKAFVDDRSGVGVVHHKALKKRVGVPLFAIDHVTDDTAEERDVRPSADRRVNIGDGAGASETRIDMDDFGAVLDFRLHRPAESDRMVFRHVGTHDDDAVGVGHAAGIECRRAAAESRPQTGDARAVSYPRLILDGDDSQTAHQFLAKVIEFDLQGGAAQGEDGGRHIDPFAAGKRFDKALVA